MKTSLKGVAPSPTARPTIPLPCLRANVAKVAGVCAAVMIPIMFEAPGAYAMTASDNTAFDRLVTMEEREIPELITRLDKSLANSRVALDGLMSIVEQVEDDITRIQMKDMRDTSALQDLEHIVEDLESRMDMVRDNL
jgi:hypothetical protein